MHSPLEYKSLPVIVSFLLDIIKHMQGCPQTFRDVTMTLSTTTYKPAQTNKSRVWCKTVVNTQFYITSDISIAPSPRNLIFIQWFCQNYNLYEGDLNWLGCTEETNMMPMYVLLNMVQPCKKLMCACCQVWTASGWVRGNVRWEERHQVVQCAAILELKIRSYKYVYITHHL